jgi:DNA-binding transcriptional ArsR family regulator
MTAMHELGSDFEMPTEVEVHVAADAFRLLSDPNRIKILWALMQGETSVNCLAELVGASASSVSQHLSKLRLAGLVNVRREGTFAYYTAADGHVLRLLGEALFHADHATNKIAAGQPHDHRRNAKVRPRTGARK